MASVQRQASLDGFAGDETSLSVIFRRMLYHSGYRGKPKNRRSDSQDRPDGRRLTLISLAQAHGPLLKGGAVCRSEEHTSELQSHHDLVCRLLLEKKNK